MCVYVIKMTLNFFTAYAPVSLTSYRKTSLLIFHLKSRETNSLMISKKERWPTSSKSLNAPAMEKRAFTLSAILFSGLVCLPETGKNTSNNNRFNFLLVCQLLIKSRCFLRSTDIIEGFTFFLDEQTTLIFRYYK